MKLGVDAQGRPFHPGVTGKGKTGRVNVSEPSMMPRYAKLRMMDAKPGFKNRPLRGGRRRPESLCRSCEHRRSRGLEGTHPGRDLMRGQRDNPFGARSQL